MTAQTRTASPRWISAADTAKLVRAALRAAFPAVKFSVRSKTYSGGASISVRYVDGPTSAQVEAVAGQFAGSTFDGSIDLKSSHVSTLDGEAVRYAADYVFVSRAHSPRLVARALAQVAAYYGLDAATLPGIVDGYEGAGALNPHHPLTFRPVIPGSTYDLAQVVRQAGEDRTRFAPRPALALVR